MYTYDFTLIPGSVETLLEIINLALALIAAFFSFKVAALVQGGKLEKVWNLLALGIGAFALLEIYGTLKMAKILHVGGLGDILETFMVIFFLLAFNKAKNIFLKDTLGK